MGLENYYQKMNKISPYIQTPDNQAITHLHFN